MASGLGILASMLAGGGKGVQDNAQRSMDEKAKLAEEQRKEAGILARMQEQRGYDENKYKQQLADQERIESERYQRDKADKLAAEEANRKHQINLAKIQKEGSRSASLLANNIASFERRGSKYLDSIDKIEGDSDLSPEQKLAATAPLYAGLDELVKNNPSMEEYSPLYGSFHFSAESFMSQHKKPEAVKDSSANVNNGYVIPIEQADGSTKDAILSNSDIMNLNIGKAQSYTPSFSSDTYQTQARSVLDRVSNQPLKTDQDRFARGIEATKHF